MTEGRPAAVRTVRAIPEGYHTVTPYIVTRGTAELIGFLENAFDAKEEGRFPNPDGSIGHAEVRIGNSVVMLFDARDEWPPTPSFLRLYLDDADATYERALEAGAVSVTEMTDSFFGDRGGRVRDPLGNIWWLQTHVEDVSHEDLARRAGEKKYVDAMKLAQDTFDRELRSRVS